MLMYGFLLARRVVSNWAAAYAAVHSFSGAAAELPYVSAEPAATERVAKVCRKSWSLKWSLMPASSTAASCAFLSYRLA
jgi:hypothetical protein